MKKKNTRKNLRKKYKQKRKLKRKNNTSRKKRKTFKGGSLPFDGLQNLFSEFSYAVQSAIHPLLDNTVDDKLVNPNPAVQFQGVKMDQPMIAGPSLNINK